MSLIIDALKVKGRGHAPSTKDQQLIDGFFPYVSSTPPRRRSRLMPALVIGLGSAALLSIVGWYALATFAKPAPKAHPSIVLPPPSIAQAPMARIPPSTVAAGTSEGHQAGSVSTTAPSSSEPAASAPAPGAKQTVQSVRVQGTIPESRVPLRAVDSRSSRTDTTIVSAGERVLAPSSASPVDRAPARIDYEAQGTALFNSGDFLGARERFQLATRFAPTARAWTNYGVTLQKLGDTQGAASAYQSAIGVDANYLEAWLYQGRLAVLQGDVARAVPLFQRARSINPRNAEVNVELSYLEYEAKNWTEARRFAEEAVRGDAASSRAHWFLAASSDQLKDFEIASREYAAFLQTVNAGDRDQAVYVGWARQRLAELRGKP